eukprot:COSAG02_NODE_1940_length_10311_cov_37.311496_6_plen_155_part_00
MSAQAYYCNYTYLLSLRLQKSRNCNIEPTKQAYMYAVDPEFGSRADEKSRVSTDTHVHIHSRRDSEDKQDRDASERRLSFVRAGTRHREGRGVARSLPRARFQPVPRVRRRGRATSIEGLTFGCNYRCRALRSKAVRSPAWSQSCSTDLRAKYW